MSDELVETLARIQLDSRVMYNTFRGEVEGLVPTEFDVTAADMLR
jgi:hypothetical protein